MPTTEKPTVTVNFRKLLLNRCQKEFEKDKDDDEVFEKKQKEMDEAATVKENPSAPLPTHVLLSCRIGGGDSGLGFLHLRIRVLVVGFRNPDSGGELFSCMAGYLDAIPVP